MANHLKRPSICPAHHNLCACGRQKYRTSIRCRICKQIENRPKYLLSGDLIIAKTATGKIFLLSSEDEDLLQYSWHTSGAGPIYVHRSERTKTGHKNKTLHTEILQRLGKLQPGHIIDHKNWCGVDNRRTNIRSVTVQGNNSNKRPRNKLGITGVRFFPGPRRLKPYHVQCCKRFAMVETLEKAIELRKTWEKELYGDN